MVTTKQKIPKKIKVENLISITLYHLKLINDDATEETKHKEALGEGMGDDSPIYMYRFSINFLFDQIYNKLPKWPKNWIELTPKQLAPKLIKSIEN